MSSKKEDIERKEKPKCSICMETIARAEINCPHRFCMKCIKRWIKVRIFRCREKKIVLYADSQSLLFASEQELNIFSRLHLIEPLELPEIHPERHLNLQFSYNGILCICGNQYTYALSLTRPRFNNPHRIDDSSIIFFSHFFIVNSCFLFLSCIFERQS